MAKIQQRGRIDVDSAGDMVRVRIGSGQAIMHYRTVFAICAGIRAAARHAMCYDATPHGEWVELASDERADEVQDGAQRAKQFRVSGQTPTLTTEWRVDVEHSANVILVLQDYAHTMHYSDALKVQSLLRANARVAKAWAGDTGRVQIVTGVLTDAEKNASRPAMGR